MPLSRLYQLAINRSSDIHRFIASRYDKTVMQKAAAAELHELIRLIHHPLFARIRIARAFPIRGIRHFIDLSIQTADFDLSRVTAGAHTLLYVRYTVERVMLQGKRMRIILSADRA